MKMFAQSTRLEAIAEPLSKSWEQARRSEAARYIFNLE